MRDVFERLEALDLPYYMTGSEALARYSQPRQTMDVDIVVAIAPARFDTIARAFAEDFVVNSPIDFGSFAMASLIARSALGKADLILGRDDAWSRAALERRERWEHPLYGPLWVTSLEDLLLAKLEWSQGASELQLRDCRLLIELNPGVDWLYVQRWASTLGVGPLLDEVRHAG